MPSKTAVITDELRLTYEQLNRRINCIAWGLRQQGVQKGDRVGLLINNEADYIAVFYAVIKLGACACPFNTKLLLSELDQLQEKIHCSCYVAANEQLERAVYMQKLCCQETSPKLVLLRAQEGCPGIDGFLKNGMDEWDHAEPMAGDDPLYCLFTGGTTGLPKASVHSQYATLVQILGYMMDAEISDRHTVYLHFSPMFHMGGVGGMLRILSAGGTFCLLRSFSAEKIIEYIKKERVTEFAVIPPTILNRFKAERDLDLSSLRTLKMAGGACTAATFDLVFSLMPEVTCFMAYGSSENAVYTGNLFGKEEFEANRAIFRSVGKLFHFYEAKIMRDPEVEAGINEPGELYGRSPAMMSGYLGHPNVFTEDGWYPTGDVLYRDEQGNFFFCTRVKDMIKSGGENIYALEVENAIASHESVEQCAVVGVPDAEYGEIVAAAVVLRPEARLSEKELVDYCRKKIASYKKPRLVRFLPELPLTSIKKIDKEKLRFLMVSSQEMQVKVL